MGEEADGDQARRAEVERLRSTAESSDSPSRAEDYVIINNKYRMVGYYSSNQQDR